MSAASVHAYHPFRSTRARNRYLYHYDAHAGSWPVLSETRTVATENERTFVRISGPADGPPLVLLPGEWDTSLMWMPVIEALSEDFRTYAVDNPYDFGRSMGTRPGASTADYIDYMKWLDELLDALGLPDGVNLMGCSFGAWLAADYVMQAPHRLARAVWLSPPFVVLPPPPPYVGAQLSLGAFLVPSRPTVGKFMRWLTPQAVHAPWFDGHVDDIVVGLRSFYARLSLTEPRMLTDTELHDITVPVLYVVGEHEQMCSAQAAVSRLNAVAPQIETGIIPGAGHELPLGQPEAFSQRVLEFLGAQRGLR